MARRPRRNHSPAFKAKVAVAAIKGEKTIDYTVRASAGQTMTVSLKTSNASNYFNVLPPGSTGRDLPVVILPHGGPESHDDDGFDWIQLN